MIIQQLYRYVFTEWNHLSEQEKKDAPIILEPFINNRNFQSAIKALGANDLYQSLYGEKSVLSYYQLAKDDYPFSWYSSCNQLYKYFDNTENKNDNNVIVFKSLYQLFDLYYEITKPKSSSYKGILEHSISNFCYKLMVVFGHEDIMLVLSKIESYCESLNKPLDHSIFNLFLNFELGINPDNQYIDLPAWREFLLCKDLTDGKQIFNIAPEIEKTLGGTPKTIEAAIEAAKSRKFTNYDKCPEFAGFCIEQFIPEEDFNGSISSNHIHNYQFFISILQQLPPGKLSAFIQSMPDIKLDVNQIYKLLDLLKHYQVNFITRFPAAFKNAITNELQLASVLGQLTTMEAQQKLIKCLSKELILNLIGKESFWGVKLILEKIHSDYQLEFIHSVISIEKLRILMDSFVNLDEFIKICLPTNNQVQFLKDTVGIEKIRALSTSHCIIVDQLKQLDNDEKIVYLTEIIGAALLNQVIENNWCMLESVLNEIPAELRLSAMVNIIGIDRLRNIIPTHGDLRAQKAISILLPAEHRSLFLEQLFTNEEKQAQIMLINTKQRITNFQFSTGFLGLGFSGEEITLDDGNKKTVPNTVKAQWSFIKRAENKDISSVEAWAEVKKLGVEVKPTSGTLHYFFRATDTKDYYKSFNESPKLNEQTL